MSDAFVRVALPLPLHTGYTYRATPALRERLEPGMRVLVPVRSRMLIGLVTEMDVVEPSVAARDILEVPDREPVLTRPLLETVQWIASYYGAPLGLALRAAVPAGTWGSSRPQAVHERMVMLAGHVPGLEEREKLLKRSAGQRKLLELLEALGGMAPARVLKEQHGISDAVIRGLVSRGLASIAKQEVVRDPFAGVAGTPPPAEPNAPQREETTFIQRDYRTGNYLVHEARLAGVLDWEFAAFGNPLEDLGWICARCWRLGASVTPGGSSSIVSSAAASTALREKGMG